MDLKRFCRLWGRTAFRRVVIAVMVGVAAYIVVWGTLRALQGSSEFMGFRRIVQVSIVHDKNHYEHIPHIRAYPPFFAIFWSPYGLFPASPLSNATRAPENASVGQRIRLTGSAAVVLLLMTAMTIWAVRFVMAACYRPQEGESASCGPALLWVLSGGLMLNSVVRCETDMFVVVMVAGAMYLMLARGRPWTGGILLGVAAALKLTPGLFGVYLLCRRKWRALGAMALGGVVCTVVLPALVWGFEGAVDRHRSWLERVIVPYAKQGPEAFITRPYRQANQSLKAAVVRYLTRCNAGSKGRPRYVNVADLRMGTVRKIALGLKVVVLGLLLAAWILPAPGRSAELETVLFALVPLGMLLLSDISVGGHLAILAVPFGALLGFCFRRGRTALGRRVSWGVLCAFVLCHLIAVRTLKQMSVGTAGVIVLYGLTAYVAWRLHCQSGEQSAVQAC